MANDDPSSVDHREWTRRRINGKHNGTRSGVERRQTTEEEWTYFEKRSIPDRRSGSDRRDGDDRRDE